MLRNHHRRLASRKISSVEELETLSSDGHKAKDTTPSIAWRREAEKEEALNDLPREDANLPNNIGTVSKANIGETPERRSRANMGFPEHIDTILN